MQPLSRLQVREMIATDARAQIEPKRHAAPFSKSGKGAARRNARRAAITRKRAWLAS